MGIKSLFQRVVNTITERDRVITTEYNISTLAEEMHISRSLLIDLLMHYGRNYNDRYVVVSDDINASDICELDNALNPGPGDVAVKITTIKLRGDILTISAYLNNSYPKQVVDGMIVSFVKIGSGENIGLLPRLETSRFFTRTINITEIDLISWVRIDPKESFNVLSYKADNDRLYSIIDRPGTRRTLDYIDAVYCDKVELCGSAITLYCRVPFNIIDSSDIDVSLVYSSASDGSAIATGIDVVIPQNVKIW